MQAAVDTGHVRVWCATPRNVWSLRSTRCPITPPFRTAPRRVDMGLVRSCSVYSSHICLRVNTSPTGGNHLIRLVLGCRHSSARWNVGCRSVSEGIYP